MTKAWVVVAVVGVATIAIKGAGPVLLGGRELPAPIGRVVVLLGPSLLAALVVTQVFAEGTDLVVDERLAGLGAAFPAVLLRAPVLVVVIVAAAVTAVVRLAL
jgi:branched-subunit amino acid transport protein